MGLLSLDWWASRLRAMPAEAAKFFAAIVPIDRYEITDPAAASNTSLLAATPTVATPVTVTKAELLAGGLSALAAYPRRLSFTTGGGTAADAPASVTVKGKDASGQEITETVNLGQTATTVNTTAFFADLDTDEALTYPAADGTGATVSVGITSAIGFTAKPRLVNGAVAAIAEWTDGVPSGTRGTYITPVSGAPFGGVTFNTAPNGTHDYAIWFERDLG